MSYKETLEWFGAVLKKPIDGDSCIIPSSETEKASFYISPSPTLNPTSRLEIYAQQYWWRLFSTMQDHYPLLTRLFGYQGFNEQIAQPYLVKHPPNHWNINLLGENLLQYLKLHYNAPDASLVSAAAELDWLHIHAFIQKRNSLPSSETEPLYLSSSTFLVSYKWDLSSFRNNLLKESPDYWVDNDFPELKKGEFYFILKRTPDWNIVCDQIQSQEFKLLKEFEKGLSLTDLCQTSTELHEDLTQWIPRWIAEGLLTPEKPH